MARSRNQEHVKVITHYQVVEVIIDQVNTRAGTPMT